jgi:hypothetical protein
MRGNCILMLSLAALATGCGFSKHEPSFAGTWVGTAQRAVCSAAPQPVKVVLRLEDKPLAPKASGAIPLGTVSGTVDIDGAPAGNVPLMFDASGRTLSTPLNGVYRPSALGGLQYSNSTGLTEHWFNLQASDQSGDRFEKLTGTLSRPNADCPQSQDRGEQIQVVLTRQ